MKEKKKTFISVISGIFKCITLICILTVLIPTMNVRAEGEMVSLGRWGTSQLGYYLDPDGYCVYCANEMLENADYGGEIYTKSIGGGYEMYDGICGVQQEAFSEGKLDESTIRVITQLAIWSKTGNSQREAVEWYYSDNGVELFDRMMSADPGDYDVTYIIYTPSDDCYQTCVGAYAVSKNVQHTHSWDAGTITRESTYNADGEITYTCTGCGETRTEAVPRLVCGDHAWNSGTVTTSPTYQSTGVKTYTCTNCGATKTEVIPKLTCTNHAWDEGKVTTDPTYKTEGVKTYTCENCGETKTETISKLVCTTHAWDNGKITTKATYKNDGVKTYTCKNCGETKTVIIPQFVCTKHVYGDALLTPAGNGFYYYISECTRCGEKHSERHEHNYKWVTVKPATESETGIERHLCEECGYYTAEREISTGKVVSCTHPYPRDFVETVPATCCSYPKGNIVCKECGEIVLYDYEYAKLGYDPDNHAHFTATVRVEPTYKSNGVMRYTCDGCGYYYTESIPKLVCKHDGRYYIKHFSDVNESWVFCDLCDEKLRKTSNGPSCSHIGTTKTQVLIKEATSTEWGEVATVCSCGKTVSTEKIHPYSEYQVTRPDGSVVTVYGWFDYDAAREIADLTNAYRIENGLNALNYNESLQGGSDTRALETIVKFSHERPDGTRWTTTLPEWTYGGENLASGQTTVESAMRAWKESESHNDNLLYGIKSGQTPFKGISVGVFHRYIFNNSGKPYTPSEYTYYTQQFTFY